MPFPKYKIENSDRFTKEQATLAAQTLSVSFDQFTFEDFLKGMNHELEHIDVTGGDPIKTAEIALTHLKEDGKYYEKLDKIEGVHNAKELPQIFYAKHIREGIAYYPLASEDKKMLLVKDEVLKKMMPSFISKPAFVQHQDVEVSDVEKEADGYITDSFYNQLDGCYWVKGIAVSDDAQKAIRNGWGVSNAYNVSQWGEGGTYNNVEYGHEVLDGVYDHLAIVDNPRYEWAKIYTPEEFKAYQEEKKAELEQLQNSKDKVENNKKENKKMFNIFKKTPVQNSDLDLENTMIELKNGSVVSLSTIVNAVEEDEDKKTKEEEENKKNALNSKTKINTKNGEKTVEELVKHYEENCSKKNDDDEEETEEEKKAKELAEKEAENSKKKNDDDDDDKSNESEDEDDSKKENSKEALANSKIYFDRLKNASEKSTEIKTASVGSYDSVKNQRERGNSRYGSK